MHVLICTDQHPDSLGGVQVALRLQRRVLEEAGHRVTIVSPQLHRGGSTAAPRDGGVHIELPSWSITSDGEYGMSWPGARSDRALARQLRKLPRVDLVHIQGDFWGALIGIRAARGLRVPVIYTMHNHVDKGTRAVTPFAPLLFVGLRLWRVLALGRARSVQPAVARGAWRYLAELAAEASIVTAPSAHFAHALRAHGVAADIAVAPNGVDDMAIAAARAMPRSPRVRPKLVWLGRMSHEKRILEFIQAIAASGIDADVTLYGAGLLLPRVTKLIAVHGLHDRVRISGPVPHSDALIAIRQADALVQTSIGFETQGLTPFEAAALGTPTIYSDPEIADDVSVTPEWRVAGESVEALAATLKQAVAEIAAGLDDRQARSQAPGCLRVGPDVSRRFLQSAHTPLMLELYERALDMSLTAALDTRSARRAPQLPRHGADG